MTLRKKRRADLRPLIAPEIKRMRAYVRQLKRRKHPDTEKATRRVDRLVKRYELNKKNIDTWIPPYGKVEKDGAVSLDPEVIYHAAMEIRRFHHYHTLQLFTESFPSEPVPLLRYSHGRLDAGVQDWLHDLYANLCWWVPAKASGKKPTHDDAFIRQKRRSKVLSLTVAVANHYVPALMLTAGSLAKLIRPIPDEIRNAKARRKRHSQAAAREILASIDRRSIAPSRR